MKTNTAPVLVATLAILMMSLFTSCRTVRGFGRDVQHVGSKIESKAAQVSPY